jgi:glucokinase
MQKTIIGLDIGGSKTALIEGTPSGEILQRYEFPTIADSFLSGRDSMIRDVQCVLNQAAESSRTPIAISISIGGPMKISEGLILNPPNLPGWHGINLKRNFGAAFPHLPIYLENDANAGALAELEFGIGKSRPNIQSLVFLTCGTGLGAGVIVNGHIVHGATDTAGEVGHWRLSEKGPIGYGKAGSWEGFSSGAGLVRLAAMMYPNRWDSATPIRRLVTDILDNDPEALAVAREAGVWMGRGIALLIDVLNPEAVVLGSLGVVLGHRLLEAICEIVAQEALPQARLGCEILPSGLGSKIGDLASMMAALTAPSIRKELES